MGVTGFTRLMFANALWRLTGSRAVGRRLVGALDSDDEDLREIAGVCLVRGGRRAGPLLIEAIETGRDAPDAIVMLADVGDPTHEPYIRGLAQNDDPEVAEAARQALRVLEHRRGVPEVSPTP